MMSAIPRVLMLIGMLGAIGGPSLAGAEEPSKRLRAGAVSIDVTPLEFPVIVNGGMTERTADKVVDRLHARALVLDDGVEQAAIVVVDSCMMPRELLDEAKELASRATGIRVDHMLISATHTHSAPSVHACLGSDADAAYSRFLVPQLAKAIQQAHQQLAPARIGWAVGRDERNVATRRWVMQPGASPTNPFGGTKDDRARMHPGHNNPQAIRATGLSDPEVPVVSVQTADGRPLAVFSAYSLHYVGAEAVSADYFGMFCERLEQQLTAADSRHPLVAALANGTSGDTWLMDYTEPERRTFDRATVAEQVAAAALEAYGRIEYLDWAPLVMRERLLTLEVRLPDAAELAAAREAVRGLAGAKPKTVPEVYAREAVLLSELPPTRELKLQALRIGSLGIAAIPNEVFGETGLAIKRNSPIPTTFTMELANGAEGYIPPPEQHVLGGYTTWRARTSCLEPYAEPKIRRAVIELLLEVDSQRRE